MKNFYQLIFACAIAIFMDVGASAQLNCLTEVGIELDQFTGMATVTPDLIIVGEVPEGATVDVAELSCNDLFKTTEVSVSAVIDGNNSSCKTSVIALDVSKPVAIAEETVIINFGPNQSSYDLSTANIDEGSYDICGDIDLKLSPSTLFCSDIGTEVMVTLIVTDESGNKNESFSTVIVNGSSTKFTCKSSVEVPTAHGTRLTTDFFVNENACIAATTVITDSQGNVVPDNIITPNYIGQMLTAIITDNIDGYSCTSTLNVIQVDCAPFAICDTECIDAPVTDCDGGRTDTDNADWPCDITIEGGANPYDDIEIGNLLAIGFTRAEVEPTLVLEPCHLVATHYEDFIFEETDRTVVKRLWTVIEWYSMAAYSYEQIITLEGTTNSGVWNICDTQSNSAPPGDCDSGHSDTDDVEWPSDISINDHRIAPQDLVAFSSIAAEDSRPAIVNNQQIYDVEYIDILESLTATTIDIKRRWTITSSYNPDESATYDQSILINLDNNLPEKVTVATHGGRPMSNVEINGVYTTDALGVTYTSEEPTDFSYPEDDVLNGLNVTDMVLIRAHILGQSILSKGQQLSADVNNNGVISTFDMVMLHKAIIENEIHPDADFSWKFNEDRSYNWLGNNGDFIGFKGGDVDDSAVLNDGGDVNKDNNIVIADEVMNIGESYTIDLTLEESLELRGVQMFFDIDLTSTSVKDVKSFVTAEQIEWSVEDGRLGIVFTTEAPLPIQGRETSNPDYIISIELEATDNSTIAQSVKFTDSELSLIVDSDLNEIYLGGAIENEITSGTDDIFTETGLSIFPNPAQNIVEVNLEEDTPQLIELFSITGTLIGRYTKNRIDVSPHSEGMYIIKARGEEKTYVSRLFIKR